MKIQWIASGGSALKGAACGEVLSRVFLPLKILRKSNIFPFSLGVLGQGSRFMPANFTAWEQSLENLFCFVVFLSAPVACWGKKKNHNSTISNFANGLGVFSSLFFWSQSARRDFFQGRKGIFSGWTPPSQTRWVCAAAGPKCWYCSPSFMQP